MNGQHILTIGPAMPDAALGTLIRQLADLIGRPTVALHSDTNGDVTISVPRSPITPLVVNSPKPFTPIEVELGVDQIDWSRLDERHAPELTSSEPAPDDLEVEEAVEVQVEVEVEVADDAAEIDEPDELDETPPPAPSATPRRWPSASPISEQQILAALDAEPISCRDLHKLLAYPATQVALNHRLRRLEGQGLVAKCKDGWLRPDALTAETEVGVEEDLAVEPEVEFEVDPVEADDIVERVEIVTLGVDADTAEDEPDVAAADDALGPWTGPVPLDELHEVLMSFGGSPTTPTRIRSALSPSTRAKATHSDVCAALARLISEGRAVARRQFFKAVDVG